MIRSICSAFVNAPLFRKRSAGARNLEADKATAMHVLDENAGGTLPVQHPASDNKQTCGELVGLANWLPPKEPR